MSSNTRTKLCHALGFLSSAAWFLGVLHLGTSSSRVSVSHSAVPTIVGCTWLLSLGLRNLLTRRGALAERGGRQRIELAPAAGAALDGFAGPLVFMTSTLLAGSFAAELRSRIAETRTLDALPAAWFPLAIEGLLAVVCFALLAFLCRRRWLHLGADCLRLGRCKIPRLHMRRVEVCERAFTLDAVLILKDDSRLQIVGVDADGVEAIKRWIADTPDTATWSPSRGAEKDPYRSAPEPTLDDLANLALSSGGRAAAAMRLLATASATERSLVRDRLRVEAARTGDDDLEEAFEALAAEDELRVRRAMRRMDPRMREARPAGDPASA